MVENGFVVKASFEKTLIYNQIDTINEGLTNLAIKPLTPNNAFEKIEEITNQKRTSYGYSLDSNFFLYDFNEHQVVYLNAKRDVIYPANVIVEPSNSWALVDNKAEFDDAQANNYNLILDDNYTLERKDITLTSGFDVGNNNLGLDLTYTGGSNTETSSVIINTNKDRLTINNAYQSIKHFGTVSDVTILKTANDSYHEEGVITSSLVINEGRVVLENKTAIIPLVTINIKDSNAVVKLENNSTIKALDLKAEANVEVKKENYAISSSTESKIDVATLDPAVATNVTVDEVFIDSIVKPTVTETINEISDLDGLKGIVNGGNYRLMNNLILDTTISISSDFSTTLDFNGFTIDYVGVASRTFKVLAGGTLTVKNGTTNSIVKDSGGVSCTTPSTGLGGEQDISYGVFDVFGNLFIHGGYYSDVGYSGATLRVRGSGVIKIYNASLVSDYSNCTIYCDGDIEIFNGFFYTESSNRVVLNQASYYAYCIRSAGTFVMHNGYVFGIQGGIALISGTATIYNCDVEVNDINYDTDNSNRAFYALYVAGEKGVINANIYNGSFKSSGYAVAQIGNDNDGGNKEEANARIYGGIFEALPKVGTINTKLFNNSPTIGSATLYGGKYYQDVSDSKFAGAYIGEGYEVVFEDPYFVVKKIETI